jgi:integrase
MALPSASARVLSNSAAKPRSVKPVSKRWQPPEGLAPEEIGAIIAAAATERDRLLLTTLWATGARISEVLTLRPRCSPRRPGSAQPEKPDARGEDSASVGRPRSLAW